MAEDSMRDTSREGHALHEHNRYRVLRRIFDRCGASPGMEVAGRELVRELDLAAEEIYRAIEFLARQGYVHYLGGGPRVRIARKGMDYILDGRGRRQTVRDAPRPAA